MVPVRLSGGDEGLHPVGAAPHWSESRYVDFFDRDAAVGGWLRLGVRPNERHAEVSVCVNLPDGGAAVMFARPPVDANALAAGGQTWAVDEPYRTAQVDYAGDLHLLADPWSLTAPGAGFAAAEPVPARLSLRSTGAGLQSVMGSDQAHIPLIFLPGQADWHYQHLVRTTGTVEIGDRSWTVDGVGGRDHSWGPRDWHAKVYFRWLVAMADDDFGMMLTRAVGPTTETRGGFVWDSGVFHLVDHFDMTNSYTGAPDHRLRRTRVDVRAGVRRWSAQGTPVQWVPLRHRHQGRTLRIVKSPTEWVFGDGRMGGGMCEYHDMLDGGVPAGLHE